MFQYIYRHIQWLTLCVSVHLSTYTVTNIVCFSTSMQHIWWLTLCVSVHLSTYTVTNIVYFSTSMQHIWWLTLCVSVHLCNIYGDYETHDPLPLNPGDQSFAIFSLTFSSDNREILGGYVYRDAVKRLFFVGHFFRRVTILNIFTILYFRIFLLCSIILICEINSEDLIFASIWSCKFM